MVDGAAARLPTSAYLASIGSNPLNGGRLHALVHYNYLRWLTRSLVALTHEEGDGFCLASFVLQLGGGSLVYRTWHLEFCGDRFAEHAELTTGGERETGPCPRQL